MAFSTYQELGLIAATETLVRNYEGELAAGILAEEAQLLKASQDLHCQTATQRHQRPPERMYLAVDGFQVPFADAWHEMKAGVWFCLDLEHG